MIETLECIQRRVTKIIKRVKDYCYWERWEKLGLIHFIILSCHQHGYPRPSLATPPYRSSLLAGPQGYIPYPHIAAVYSFELVALLLLGHVRGPIGEHRKKKERWSLSKFLLMKFLIMVDILSLFLLKLEIYCQDRFQKLSLLTRNRVICFWNKLPNQR